MSLNVDTDAVLLIDAAFNSVKHKVMLHNLKFISLIIDTYIIHCYGTFSRLFITGGGEILSSELKGQLKATQWLWEHMQ